MAEKVLLTPEQYQERAIYKFLITLVETAIYRNYRYDCSKIGRNMVDKDCYSSPPVEADKSERQDTV